LLLRWFSKELGLVDTIAKGALRQNAKAKQQELDLFQICQLEIVQSKSNSLHTLSESHCQQELTSIRASYQKQLVTAYLIELMQTLCEKQTPSIAYYDLLLRALEHLNKEPQPASNFLSHFEKELAKVAGVYSRDTAPLQSLSTLMSYSPKKRESCRQALSKLSHQA